MIARTDDGHFDVKKLVVVNPKDQPKKYKTVASHLEIELSEKPLRYTSCPNVNKSEGVWPTTGINEKNVGMTATETITSNPRVLAADPLVEYKMAGYDMFNAMTDSIAEETIRILTHIRVEAGRAVFVAFAENASSGIRVKGRVGSLNIGDAVFPHIPVNFREQFFGDTDVVIQIEEGEKADFFVPGFVIVVRK